jgi:hypothetical protein
VRRRAALIGAVCLFAALLAFPVAAASLTVQEALAHAEALKGRGVLAVFSPDYGPLKDAVLGAGKAWRAQVKTAKPPVCAPSSVNYSQDDAMMFLRAVKPADRATTPAQTAIINGLNARYRCK